MEKVKKRRYKPPMVPGKYMEDSFWEVEVGETYDIQGTVDDVIYNIWGMKDPTYVMKMMATGDQLLADETCNETARR